MLDIKVANPAVTCMQFQGVVLRDGLNILSYKAAHLLIIIFEVDEPRRQLDKQLLSTKEAG